MRTPRPCRTRQATPGPVAPVLAVLLVTRCTEIVRGNGALRPRETRAVRKMPSRQTFIGPRPDPADPADPAVLRKGRLAGGPSRVARRRERGWVPERLQYFPAQPWMAPFCCPVITPPATSSFVIAATPLTNWPWLRAPAAACAREAAARRSRLSWPEPDEWSEVEGSRDGVQYRSVRHRLGGHSSGRRALAAAVRCRAGLQPLEA